MSSTYVTEPNTNGKVVLHTTLGALDVELWPKESPKAVRNFVQLCLEGYYDNCLFHRLIKDFIVQTGDASGSGDGGESIYGGEFAKEFHSRLRFSHRGIVAMAGGPDGNLSQFFITLDKAPQLDRKHTIFGKLTGNTIFNLLAFNDLVVGADERPLHPPKILRTEVLACPFDDIVPRVRAKPLLVPAAAAAAAAPTDAAAAAGRRATNRNVLSFVENDGDDDDDADGGKVLPPVKLVPVHAKPTPMMIEAQSKRRRTAEPEPSSSSSSSNSSSNSSSASRSDSKSSRRPPESDEAGLALLEAERKLKAEIRAARFGIAEAKPTQKAPEVELDAQYDVAAKRAKFAAAAKVDREKAALAKLAGFTQKVRAVDPPALQSASKGSGGGGGGGGGDDDDDDDPRSLFSHALVFEKKAKHIDEIDKAEDRFDVHDPLADPLAATSDTRVDSDERKRREAIRSGGHVHASAKQHHHHHHHRKRK